MKRYKVLNDNTLAIKSLLDVLGRIVNDVKCLVKHFHMVQTQLEQISNVQKYLLANNAKQDNLQAYGIKTWGGTHTQDPLYLEGHPKRIEQDSQVQEEEIVSSPKKKKKKNKHKEADNSNDPIEEEGQAVDPNNISTSDDETVDGAEPEKDVEKNDPPEIREEEVPDKHKKYTREDFLARRHGKEREPWVQKPMPFPGKSVKTKEQEHYNKFCEWMKPLFLQIPLTDAIKLPPYSKYMKDIVTNK